MGARAAVLPVDQVVATLRNVGLLSLVAGVGDPVQAGGGIWALTVAQMLGALIFARFGEPILLAPLGWEEGRRARRHLALTLVAAVLSGFVTLGVGAWLSLPPALFCVLGVAAFVSSWHDAVRCFEARISRGSSTIVRNVSVTVAVWGASLMDPSTTLLVGLSALLAVIAALTSPAFPKGTADDHAWTQNAAGRTGVGEVFLSYGVTYATLALVQGAIGIAFLAPFRLAQACIGPVQVLSSGIRLGLTARLKVRAASDGFLLAVATLTFVLAVAYVGALLVMPDQMMTVLLSTAWSDVKPLIVPLGAQAVLLTIGSTTTAQLRVRGKYGAALSLRAGSALLSVGALAFLLERVDFDLALWGLCLGPAATLPAWWALTVSSNRKQHA